MFVRRVGNGAVGVAGSWTLIGEDLAPVGPVDGFLAHLSVVGRSPNTVKAYAYDLKDYWEFLRWRCLDWREVRLEDLGEFVAWLRRPPETRCSPVVVLVSVPEHVGASTINRKLAAVSAFYTHQVRLGVDVGELLRTWAPGGQRGGWKPFLYHVSKSRPAARRTISLRTDRKLPRVLTVEEIRTILCGCDRLRDRFLFALLYDSGMRVGEALGLRHEDIAAAECQVTVVGRDNDNGARSKSRTERRVPVSPALIRLWADYLSVEYGDLDSDYVFVNLFAEPRGRAMSYSAVYDLVVRLRERTGLDFDPHWFRHTMATRALVRGVPVEVVSKLLGHSSVATTSSVYGHVDVKAARAALEAAGWFTDTQVVW